MIKQRLGNLIHPITDYHANGSYKVLKKNVTLKDTEDYALMIRTTNFEQDDFKTGNKFIDKHAYEYLKKSKVLPGDIIMNKIANAGSVYLMPDLGRPVSLAMNLFLIRPDSKKVNPAYIYLFLKQNKKYVKSFAQGSVTLTITKDAVRNLEILVPDRDTQDEIVNIFEIFDSKIETNKKINENLEKTAKILFKSWFIDFDPVRAKAEGRPTGLSKEISYLFPDSFENSELGEIPRGWKAGNLGTFIEPKRGKVITKSKTKPGEVPVVAGGTKPPYYHSESNALAPIVTISASGTAGYVNIYYEDIWASDCSYINKEVTDFVFFAHSFLSINQERIYDLRHGAVQQHVYPKDLIELEMVTPPTSIIEDYENKVSTFHERIKCNLEEIKTLQSLRDLLLPKLISGELKIPDAEKLVEEAGV
jgi:type I restriction enzyme, S subunit